MSGGDQTSAMFDSSPSSIRASASNKSDPIRGSRAGDGGQDEEEMNGSFDAEDPKALVYEKEWVLEFHGIEYEIFLVVTPTGLLTLEIENARTCERWSGEFTAQYIEEITQKAGNYKKFPVFVKMLSSAFSRTNESVFIDVLTYSDLELLKAKKAGAIMGSSSAAAAAAGGGGREGSASVATNNSDPSSGGSARTRALQLKRYAILTYSAQFDRVHYPLPLAFEVQPDTRALQRNIRKLRAQVKSQKTLITTFEVREKERETQDFLDRPAVGSERERELRIIVSQLRQENTELKHRLRNRGLATQSEADHTSEMETLSAANGRLKKEVSALRKELMESSHTLERTRTEAAREIAQWKLKLAAGGPASSSARGEGETRQSEVVAELRRRLAVTERELRLERLSRGKPAAGSSAATAGLLSKRVRGGSGGYDSAGSNGSRASSRASSTTRSTKTGLSKPPSYTSSTQPTPRAYAASRLTSTRQWNSSTAVLSKRETSVTPNRSRATTPTATSRARSGNRISPRADTPPPNVRYRTANPATPNSRPSSARQSSAGRISKRPVSASHPQGERYHSDKENQRSKIGRNGHPSSSGSRYSSPKSTVFSRHASPTTGRRFDPTAYQREKEQREMHSKYAGGRAWSPGGGKLRAVGSEGRAGTIAGGGYGSDNSSKHSGRSAYSQSSRSSTMSGKGSGAEKGKGTGTASPDPGSHRRRKGTASAGGGRERERERARERGRGRRKADVGVKGLKESGYSSTHSQLSDSSGAGTEGGGEAVRSREKSRERVRDVSDHEERRPQHRKLTRRSVELNTQDLQQIKHRGKLKTAKSAPFPSESSGFVVGGAKKSSSRSLLSQDDDDVHGNDDGHEHAHFPRVENQTKSNASRRNKSDSPTATPFNDHPRKGPTHVSEREQQERKEQQKPRKPIAYLSTDEEEAETTDPRSREDTENIPKNTLRSSVGSAGNEEKRRKLKSTAAISALDALSSGEGERESGDERETRGALLRTSTQFPSQHAVSENQQQQKRINATKIIAAHAAAASSGEFSDPQPPRRAASSESQPPAQKHKKQQNNSIIGGADENAENGKNYNNQAHVPENSQNLRASRVEMGWERESGGGKEYGKGRGAMFEQVQQKLDDVILRSSSLSIDSSSTAAAADGGEDAHLQGTGAGKTGFVGTGLEGMRVSVSARKTDAQQPWRQNQAVDRVGEWGEQGSTRGSAEAGSRTVSKTAHSSAASTERASESNRAGSRDREKGAVYEKGLAAAAEGAGNVSGGSFATVIEATDADISDIDQRILALQAYLDKARSGILSDR